MTLTSLQTTNMKKTEEGSREGAVPLQSAADIRVITIILRTTLRP